MSCLYLYKYQIWDEKSGILTNPNLETHSHVPFSLPRVPRQLHTHGHTQETSWYPRGKQTLQVT